MTAGIRAESLGKRFTRRLHPVPPTIKERLVGFFRGRGGPGEETFWALRNVAFTVEPGEMLGVIGSNGSGKSTLLKIVSGILRPDEGRIEAAGRVTSLIELGAGFHPDLTGRENILINGLLLGLGRREIRDRFDDIVSFAGLERFIDSPVRTYSSGMYMRLGFAIAVHSRPDVLIIDEILAVGDELFQHQCLGTVRRLLGEGKTILFVSHDLGMVDRFCNRVLWLEDGGTRHLGSPREVIDAYRDRVEATEAARVMAEHHRLTVEPLEGGGKRWGSGEVSIDRVTVTDRGGAERYLYRCGEKLALRLDYRARQPVADAVFGFALQRQDGVLCYGTNTAIDKVQLGTLDGEGTVLIELDRLDLLPGTYELDVAAHRPDGYPYDYQRRRCRIEVRGESGEAGIVRLTHRWLTAPGETAGNG